MNIQISVVIPTYRRPKLLLRCLSALSEQHFDPEAFELIVVSDGPDPLTANALAHWQTKHLPKLRYVSTVEKKGPAAARNYGWLNAKGNLIAFTDDDCIPDKNWLSVIYSQYRGEEYFALSGKVIVPVSQKPTDYERNTAGLQTADFVTANCCCSKKALVAAGGFDEQFAMAWREDSDLEFKLIKANIPVYKVNDAVVIHPVRTAPWGVSIKEQKKTLYNALLYKKDPMLYRKKIQPSPPVQYYATIIAFFIMLAGLLIHISILTWIGLALWLSLSLLFIFRRLRNTTLAPGHFLEMVVTSFCIPFLSIYWQWYGAIKYRVLLL